MLDEHVQPAVRGQRALGAVGQPLTGQFPAGAVVQLPQERRALADDEQVRARGRREGEADRAGIGQRAGQDPVVGAAERRRRGLAATLRIGHPRRGQVVIHRSAVPLQDEQTVRAGARQRARPELPGVAHHRTGAVDDLALEFEAGDPRLRRDLQGGPGGLIELIAPAGGAGGQLVVAAGSGDRERCGRQLDAVRRVRHRVHADPVAGRQRGATAVRVDDGERVRSRLRDDAVRRRLEDVAAARAVEAGQLRLKQVVAAHEARGEPFAVCRGGHRVSVRRTDVDLRAVDDRPERERPAAAFGGGGSGGRRRGLRRGGRADQQRPDKRDTRHDAGEDSPGPTPARSGAQDPLATHPCRPPSILIKQSRAHHATSDAAAWYSVDRSGPLPGSASSSIPAVGLRARVRAWSSSPMRVGPNTASMIERVPQVSRRLSRSAG
jgi:hypothetical protein